MKFVRALVLVASIPLFLVSGNAQSQGDSTFEVASIKPSRASTDGTPYGRVFRQPGRINYEYVSLQNLLVQAFRIKNSQIAGPEWLDSERFDIVATFPESTTPDVIATMMQALLRARFHLAFHRQPKEADAYGLTVTRDGPKAALITGEIADVRTQFDGSVRRLSGKVTMGYLAGLLSNLVDRPVVDLTQLNGIYDVKLAFTDDNA